MTYDRGSDKDGRWGWEARPRPCIVVAPWGLLRGQACEAPPTRQLLAASTEERRKKFNKNKLDAYICKRSEVSRGEPKLIRRLRGPIGVWSV